MSTPLKDILNGTTVQVYCQKTGKVTIVTIKPSCTKDVSCDHIAVVCEIGGRKYKKHFLRSTRCRPLPFLRAPTSRQQRIDSTSQVYSKRKREEGAKEQKDKDLTNQARKKKQIRGREETGVDKDSSNGKDKIQTTGAELRQRKEQERNKEGAKDIGSAHRASPEYSEQRKPLHAPEKHKADQETKVGVHATYIAGPSESGLAEVKVFCLEISETIYFRL